MIMPGDFRPIRGFSYNAITSRKKIDNGKTAAMLDYEMVPSTLISESTKN